MENARYATLQNAAAGTGNGSEFDVAGSDMLGAHVVISNTATVTFEGSIDGSTWASVPLLNASGTYASTATASGMFVTNQVGYKLFRARVSAFTSGTVTVYAYVGG